MRGRRFGPLTVIALGMALVLAACGADPTATPTSVPTATPLQATPLLQATTLPQATPPPDATPTPTPTPDAAALFQVEWDALIEAAHEEGELSLTFGGAAGRAFRPIVAVFDEKFGITTTIATGSGSGHVNRVLAEQTAGQYQVDVMFGGATSVNSRLIPANALGPIADLFIHPEVTDQSLWFGGKHWYADPGQQFIFTFAARAGPTNLTMRYNTDLVSQEDIDGFSSVFDYLDPKWVGKIVAHIPGGGGGGGTYYLTYVHPDIGPSWIDAFVAPELGVTFVNDVPFIIDGIAKGKFAMGIAIGGAGRDLESLGTLGAPVKAIRKDFKEGGAMTASSAIHLMTTPVNPPNPNAQKLWVNWWLTKEGQTLMHTISEADVEPTLREDVTDWGRTLAEDRKVEGQSYYFFTSDPELVLKRAEALEYADNAYKAAR